MDDCVWNEQHQGIVSQAFFDSLHLNLRDFDVIVISVKNHIFKVKDTIYVM